MRTTSDQYKLINGKLQLWNGYNYELQKWVVCGEVCDTAQIAFDRIQNQKQKALQNKNNK